VDGDTFMRGFHLVFVFSAVTSVLAIICSSLRGTEQRPGGRSTPRDVPEDVPLPRGAVVAQPTGRS
jgi:hypothetical protein